MEMTFNQNKATWYRGEDFKDSQLVTANSANEALGVTSIKFTAPKQAQIDAGVIASVYIRMDRLGFAGTIWKGKDNKQFIRFTPEQRKTKVMVDGKEETRNINLVTLDAAIEAQILRHAETFIKYEDAAPAQSEAEAEQARQLAAEAKAKADAEQMLLLQQQMEALRAQQAAVAPATQTPVVSPQMAGLSADMFAGGGTVTGADDPRPF